MDSLFSERNDLRYETELTVYVQMNIWNPFSQKHAKLIDFSLGGFKIEFLENFRLKNMEKIYLRIPLQGLGLANTPVKSSGEIADKTSGKMKTIKLRAEIKWYDPLHKQVGGTYTVPMKRDDEVLEKIIFTLAQQLESK